jgi:hypothetical protein
VIRFLLVLLLVSLAAPAQTPAPAEQPPSARQPATQPDATHPPPPHGKVLFSRDADSPDAQSSPTPEATPLGENDPLKVSDAERSALTFTAYNLDLHLAPASAALSARAALTVRNDGSAALTRLVLEISSSLHWQSFSIAGSALPFTARLIDTDADHTGQTQEAVVTLRQPLAPGATLQFTALYAGEISPSANRLERIGAPANQAAAADWDSIATNGTYLRGFGNVLWYPVASPPIFLGDGARLFQAVGSTKLRESAASVSLRLAVEYAGDPPDAAFFCGRREQLKPISDNPDLPVTQSAGIATADFAAHPLGFRTLDLFITADPPTTGGTASDPSLISAVTSHYDALPTYTAAATLVQPLLTDWFGAQPQTFLTLLDHNGQPFEDDDLLVRPMRIVEPATLAPALAHSLTHVWFHSAHPWINEGLAEFMDILWTERTQGRATALAQLQDAARSLALAEPEVPTDETLPTNSSSSATDSDTSPDAPKPSVSSAGTSLAEATGEVFYRTKAAAVWWMLREIVGDQALQQALQAYRSTPHLDSDPHGMQQAIEKASHKDLAWFFNDWVYRDRGLPDLTIVNVTPSQLDTSKGVPSGWLVAVDVRNDGYAAAEVPVTVRSADSVQTQKLRIAGRSSASTRIVFAGTPEQVQVNDGSVPEVRTSVHTRDLVLPGHSSR